jgi:hypothetical protein
MSTPVKQSRVPVLRRNVVAAPPVPAATNPAAAAAAPVLPTIQSDQITRERIQIGNRWNHLESKIAQKAEGEDCLDKLEELEMLALRDETLDSMQAPQQIQTVGVGRTGNPAIREMVKRFRYLSWNHQGRVRSGRILRRAQARVSVEPFDGNPGETYTVGYGLIYDVEPQPPAEPTANDQMRAAVSKCVHVSFRTREGIIVKGTIIRRNPKTVSVQPYGETNPKKYYLVPYSQITPIP